MPAMIQDWRARWAAVGASPTQPFVFIQLSAWPTQDSPIIPAFRVAVENALALPRVGMVVSCDVNDPAGAVHPIHPMWKKEVARRAALWADNVVFGNASSPTAGPRVVSATWDNWDATWGSYHYQTGMGSYVCGTGKKGPWFCGGVRLVFDAPVAVRPYFSAQPAQATGFYGMVSGADSGLQLWTDGNTTTPGTGTSWFQPTTLTSISEDGLTVQLNVTWIAPTVAPPRVLRYAWHDYPGSMPLVGAVSGLPVSPFVADVVPA
jgi:hypothetical protein